MEDNFVFTLADNIRNVLSTTIKNNKMKNFDYDCDITNNGIELQLFDYGNNAEIKYELTKEDFFFASLRVDKSKGDPYKQIAFIISGKAFSDLMKNCVRSLKNK